VHSLFFFVHEEGNDERGVRRLFPQSIDQI
ncbi:unnamed protein product, partial [Allacma fusca]